MRDDVFQDGTLLMHARVRTYLEEAVQTRDGHLQLRFPVPVREDHGSLVLLGCWHTARRGQWPTSHANVIKAAAGPCRQTTLDMVYRCTQVDQASRSNLPQGFWTRCLQAQTQQRL